MRHLITPILFSLITLTATLNNAEAGLYEFNTYQSPFTLLHLPPDEDPSHHTLAKEVRNQGFWLMGGGNVDVNDNYLVYWSDQVSSRNFFTFDLSSLIDLEIESVQLELTLFGIGGTPGARTYELFDVSTDAATLNNNTGVHPEIFNDLGTGNSYGQFVINEPDGLYKQKVLTFDLNHQSIDDIKQNAGGYFSIGGALVNGVSGQYIFGSSDDLIETLNGVPQRGVQRLVVKTHDNDVPEPSTIFLLGGGLLGVFWRGMRFQDGFRVRG